MQHAFFFISSLGGGGAERAMSELASWLVGNGWRVTLATLTDGHQSDRYPLDLGVRRVHIGNPLPTASLWGKLWANAVRIRSLRRALVEAAPTVVVSFIETNNVLALLAARPHKLPVVVCERTDPSQHLPNVPPIWRWGRKHFYRRARVVVAQTHGAADWLLEECGCRVEVIPNALRALPLPLAPREPWIVSAGRLEPVKGYDVVLAAFACVASELPAWRLVIVGEGSLLERLKQQADEIGIADRVDWLGYRNDVERVLERASVVALASRYEGFPNVLLESLGMGTAVVATDCRSGPSEMIIEGENGLLVPVDNVAALAGGMRRLATDPALRHALGTRAMEIRSVYAQPAVMARWSALLNSTSKRPYQ
jgi:GalNAc-alpha-(1->4)-GalNAc-alpha-(1->3)-diNAcBac-PP-undecaprenol alpha-1,4-N-acetyl-D-galactosaminyltransferase